MSGSPHRRWLSGSIAMAALAAVQRGAGLIIVTVLARVPDPRGLGAYTFTQGSSQTFYGSSTWTLECTSASRSRRHLINSAHRGAAR
jgi:hypothetical protein